MEIIARRKFCKSEILQLCYSSYENNLVVSTFEAYLYTGEVEAYFDD